MDRNKNNLIAESAINGQNNGVYYYPKEETVFSAERLIRFVGVVESLPIDGGSIFSWHQLQWLSETPSNTKVFVFIRQASSFDGLISKTWHGPYLNGAGEDISTITSRFLQIRIAMYAVATSIDIAPVVTMSEMRASCYINGSGTTLYTKLFDLSFSPKHVLLTYNGAIPEGSLVQFAVSDKESTDSQDYKLLLPNKIQEIGQLESNSGGMKLRMNVTGSSTHPVIINNFGFIVSGNGRSKLA